MDKGEFRKAAEAGWEQVTIAAKGMAEAVTTVGKSVTENAHKAIENQSGKQADQAAQGGSARRCKRRRQVDQLIR
jgi:uncharacterized protein YoxC